MPVTTGSNLTDSSHYEVENIKRWADKNLMTLNMKKTFEMVVKGKTTMPLPEPVDGITRKSELKLLGVTVNEDPCNWDVQFKTCLAKQVLDCTSSESANTTASHYKNLHCCLTV